MCVQLVAAPKHAVFDEDFSFRVRVERFKPDEIEPVVGLDLGDAIVAGGFDRDGFAQEIEKKPEFLRIQTPKLREEQGASGRESLSGCLDLCMLFADLRFQLLAAGASIMDVREPSPGHAVASLAEPERDDNGRCLMPRDDADNVDRRGIFGVVTRRIERERGSCKPVGVFVAVAVEKPVSKAFEVGRAVAAAASAFVDRDDRCEQLRNHGPGPASELFALGSLAVRPADEPHAKAVLPLVPYLQFGFVGRLLFARRGVARLPAGDGLEHCIDA